MDAYKRILITQRQTLWQLSKSVVSFVNLLKVSDLITAQVTEKQEYK